MRTRAPLVVVPDAHAIRVQAVVASQLGWAIIDGYEVAADDFNLADLTIACTGEISDRAQVSAAVLVAARGAALIVAASRDVGALLLDDLQRVGEVLDVWPDANPKNRMTSDDRALLERLASGESVTAAARALNLSRRTAHRRLDHARQVLGAPNTVEAIARFMSAADVDVGKATVAKPTEY